MNISTLAAKKLDNFTEAERVQHFNEVCEALGLDPRTRPFEYLWVDNDYEGRNLILYITKSGSNQLRRVNGIDIEPVTMKIEGGVAIATANAKSKDGRVDSCVGAVAVEGLSGKSLANAIMSAETKAKRRVTISISGLGFLDESEVQDVSGTITKVVPDALVMAAPALSVPESVASVPAEVAPSVEVVAPTAVDDRKPTTEELTGFRERYEKLAIDLQMNGVIAADGQTAAKRIRTWFLDRAGCEGKHLTFNLWTSTLGFMDQTIVTQGIKALVDLIQKETL